MSNSLINWNRVTFALIAIVSTALIVGTIWIFVDIWLPYQASRKSLERISQYIEDYKIYQLDPSLRNFEQ
ncbi:MAG: hypothetical protein Q8O49_01060 [bacterium]|nr:hypothetical protein [bacterium]